MQPSIPDNALIDPRHTFASVTDKVLSVPLDRGHVWQWLAVFGLAASLVVMLGVSALWVLIHGVGVWGVNIPVAWGFAITNFVWWIGIGHAGTLISAILLLLRQPWRNSINRFAEAMTLFAVLNAALFPLLHLGRFWKFYWIAPYPDTMGLWPQWRSPLVWDMFAVLTYATVSLIFWYIGLLPDLATLRDAARRRWARVTAGVFALGWRGEARHWQRHQMMILLLAGLATPLVVSVHSIVSLDFAISIVPGWHVTVFPPYFVAGAIYSGFAMVLTLAIPLRAAFKLHDLITERHLDVMGKVFLTAGLFTAYGYIMENFTAWFSGEDAEMGLMRYRVLGPYAPAYLALLVCNFGLVQLLWLRRVRVSPLAIFVLSVVLNVAMWLERYVIVIVSLTHDYMPSAWGWFNATVWDWTLLAGTVGLFCLNFLLFLRLMPAIPMYELREWMHARGLGRAAGSGPPAPAPKTDAPMPESSPPLSRLETEPGRLFGLVAEFDDAERLVEAARRARAAGYRDVEAYAPFPVEGLAAAIGHERTRLALVVLIGAVLGAGGAFWLQWYAAMIDYPWNVGGRPLNSWPSFVPITFEMGVLFGSLFGVFGMLARNRLPKPYHPIDNAPNFERASRDRYFLSIATADPQFDRDATASFLRELAPLCVAEIPLEAARDERAYAYARV